MLRRYFLFLIFITPILLKGQQESSLRIEPPHWWTGFKNTHLQIMVYAPNIGNLQAVIDYEGIQLRKIHKAKSPNFLFLDLHIDTNLEYATFNIQFYKDKKMLFSTPYTLKKRDRVKGSQEGFNMSDAIYLVTPDRFSNGNKSNDFRENLREKTLNREDDYGRHGGDIQGLINHLDYISEMGFTALWSTPLLINDMPEQSYHGYAITDYYQVDPRFGNLDKYIELAQKARKKDIKLIMDQVANHCGVHHWWMKDLPFDDWVNHQKRYETNQPIISSTHRRTTNQDPYASKHDKKGMNEGWFVPQMPDLNQRNPFLAKYLIQNSIWWIETLGLSGIRQDTYPYPDKDFMAQWAGQIMQEYPQFSIVGEEWSYNPLLVGYWQQGQKNNDGYQSNLSHTMDFPLQEAMRKGITNKEGWDTGLIEIYTALANDFAYHDPTRLLAFLDNHDMDRAYTQYQEDPVKLRMALSLLLFLPRVPQLYYGTEVLLDNTDKPHDHGRIRKDFPGGWDGDSQNGFLKTGLNNTQIQMQDFIKLLLNFRKQSSALQNGKLIHFVPFQGVYALFRFNEEETLFLLINKNEEDTQVNLSHFKEMNLEGKYFRNVFRPEEKFLWEETLHLPYQGAYLYVAKN